MQFYPDALKAVDDSVCHVEAAIVFLLLSVEKAGNKAAGVFPQEVYGKSFFFQCVRGQKQFSFIFRQRFGEHQGANHSNPYLLYRGFCSVML